MGQEPDDSCGESTTVTVMNTLDTATYGEAFDPIETELLLASQKAEAPILTDQYELIQRIVESALPVQVYDIDDFDFALEIPMS